MAIADRTTLSSKTYLTLGFLDFLAYYVPGVLVLLFLVIMNNALQLGIRNPAPLIEALSENGYVQGAIWTVLSLIIPYVLGHLIFPMGNIIGEGL